MFVQITDDTLREAFAPFGEIVSASVVREPVTHISRYSLSCSLLINRSIRCSIVQQYSIQSSDVILYLVQSLCSHCVIIMILFDSLCCLLLFQWIWICFLCQF